MKKIKYATAALVLATFINYSCQKEYDPYSKELITDSNIVTPPAVTSSLQHKWNLISITLSDPNSTDTLHIPADPTTDYFNFATDGKVYTYAFGQYDTSAYSIQPNGTTLLYNTITNGVQNTRTDTITIRTINDSLLVLSGKNEAGDLGVDSLRR